eukprot:312211-Pelagomonas_calceolata.AAC.1
MKFGIQLLPFPAVDVLWRFRADVFISDQVLQNNFRYHTISHKLISPANAAHQEGRDLKTLRATKATFETCALIITV